MSQTCVRFAPSPTGYMHIGGLRTALFNYLYARHMNGRFILRIEDTDRTRFVEGALENLIKVMEWSGIDYDEGPMLNQEGKVYQKGDFGPYIQSERVEKGIYDSYINKLIDEGKAYYCFCSQDRLDQLREEQKVNNETPRYDGYCRHLSSEEVQKRIANGEPYVVRLRLPEHEDITFEDRIKGKITINTDEMDDQVLIKSDGFPTYHFAVVVDDHLMGVTHIVRGEEWISSTPKHVLLYRALGWQEPEFIHLPTVLGNDHKKLSKRQGDVAVESFREKGYLPEALVNYMALLGWSPNSNEEILSMKDMIKEFDFDRVANRGGIFDIKKLNWFNQEYIKKLSNEEVASYMGRYLKKAELIDDAYPEEKLELLAKTYGNRIEYFAQVPDMTKKLFCDSSDLEYEDEAKEALKSEEACILIPLFYEKVKNEENFNQEFASTLVKSMQNETGIKGKKLWFPIRSAIVGSASGPDFTNTMLILGREEILKRLERAKEEFKF